MQRTRLVTTLAALGLAVLAAPPARAQADARPTVAVLYFNNGSFGKDRADYDALGRGIADFMITDLAGNPTLRVVERQAIDQLIKEQDLGQTNRVDVETAVKLGKLLQARYMVLGGFVASPNGTVDLTARAVEVETSRIVHVDAVKGKTDAFMDVIRQLSDRMNKGMKLPDIPRRTASTTPTPSPTTGPQVAAALPQKVPFAAVMLYSKALKAVNEGKKDEGVSLFKKCVTDFPDFDKPKEELKRLGAG
jgi:TolB-like protein